MKTVSLAEMKTGESGRVKKIYGGRGMVARLQALGLHPGKRVTKVSTFFQKGPVVVEIDRSRVAMGYGRANRIFVEIDN
ncbi:MAG TPA: ferrous iron transport protein A [Firmicutes bacterium]|jgi:ferrous iron transport protein A|nr:ferrous iron transport protein A [Bacillota bacterium]